VKSAAFLLFMVALFFSGAPAIAVCLAVLGGVGWLLWR
jgi:hypothetical protein